MSQHTLTVHLSDRASESLSQRAAKTGQDIASLAASLLEQAMARPSVDEALAPFRKQIADSGMTDDQLDACLHSELEAHRRKTKANPS